MSFTPDTPPLQLVVNAVAVGASGLGKTSVMDTIFTLAGTHYNDSGERVSRRGGPLNANLGVPETIISTATKGFVISEYRNQVRDKNTILMGYVADTSGYAFSTDVVSEVNNVLTFIENWRAPSIPKEEVLEADKHFHLCLFFLTPQRVRDMDLYTIKLISNVIPVIIVCARADSYELAEKGEYAATLMKELEPIAGRLAIPNDRVGFFVLDRQRTHLNGSVSSPLNDCYDNSKLLSFMSSSTFRAGCRNGKSIREMSIEGMKRVRDRGFSGNVQTRLQREVLDKPKGFSIVVSLVASIIVVVIISFARL